VNFKKLFTCVLITSLCWLSEAEVIDVIKVKGLQLVPQDVVMPMIDMSVGQDVEREDLKPQIAKLYQSGLFSQVVLTLVDHVLTIQLVEQPVIKGLSISSAIMDEAQVKKQLTSLGIVSGELLQEGRLEEWRVSAQLGLINAGFKNASVTTTVEQLDNGVVMLKIEAVEGAGTKLRSIDFIGDLKMPKRQLFRAVSSNSTGILSFIFNNDLFSDQQLEIDRLNVVRLYKSKGYRTPSVELKVNDTVPQQRLWDSSYKEAKFVINPGPLYSVEAVDFADTIDVWPQELKDLVADALKGQLHDASVLTGIQNIVANYYKDDTHHNFYKVEMKDIVTSFDKVKLVLSLDKHVSYVRYIHFKGNLSSQDEPLRRALTVEEAKPFDGRMLRFSEYALRNFKFLKNVTFCPQKA
jgi:outer membrane protein insertion porin family